MSTMCVQYPTSFVRFGMARVDVTPPPNMYHRFWGAACHDRGTGIHRPLTAEVMIFGPPNDAPQLVRAQVDFLGLVKPQHQALVQTLSEVSGLAESQIILCYSHTHSAGHYAPERFDRPGGELIADFLADVNAKMRGACAEALTNVQDVVISYATGRCNMAVERDYWDMERGIYVCGYNPDTPADDTVQVARITDKVGALLATVVNYGCHPISLAWENTLFSPDYVGAMRATVEQVTRVPCIFAQGACGDLMPRVGLVGDPAIADSNGRQLGYAALSALESMQPPATDFAYQGPVISGATLGTWAPVGLNGERRQRASIFTGATHHVELPMIPKPDRAALLREISERQAQVEDADARGDTLAARDANAHIERTVRWLARLETLPAGETFPFPYSVYRMGDAIWVTCGGEPYNVIQQELRRRFPDIALLFTPIASEMQVAYLLPKDRYGKGLYQEEPSILAAGCLEILAETITAQIQALH